MFGLMKVMNHQLHDLAMVKSQSRRERERKKERESDKFVDSSMRNITHLDNAPD
jgi:hypothetical protein